MLRIQQLTKRYEVLRFAEPYVIPGNAGIGREMGSRLRGDDYRGFRVHGQAAGLDHSGCQPATLFPPIAFKPPVAGVTTEIGLPQLPGFVSESSTPAVWRELLTCLKFRIAGSFQALCDYGTLSRLDERMSSRELEEVHTP